MKVMPIRYCTDVETSRRFYTALGLLDGDASRGGVWVELPAASGMLALHDVARSDDGGAPRTELGFETDEPLETVVARLASAGFTPEPIVDENFGRSVGVLDPDGLRVQVNEHDRELYT